MKKIIIAVLLLIPLIVILTITASGRIISAEVAIQIESVELWHKGERVSEATINLGEYKKKNLKYQLIPKYFPVVAQVSGFRWTSDNPEVATVDEDGIVSFHECGFAKVTAVSLDYTTVKASCAFFVEDDEIHRLTCYAGGDDAVTSLSLKVFEEKQVRVDVMPYSAFVGDLMWSSSDPGVLSVDANGVIKAMKEGKVTLTLRAKSKNGKTAETALPVTVAGTSLVKQKDVYLFGDGAADLTPYLSSGEVVGGNVIDLSLIAKGGKKTFLVRGTGEEEITVHRLSYQNSIGIQNYDLLLTNEWKDGVYLGAGRSITLTPVDLSTGQVLQNVEIRSSDASVLGTEGGKIVAKNAGKARIFFRKAGYEEFSVEISVAVPISYFSLNVDEEYDAVGLGSERVYGTMSVYDGSIENGIRITAENVYPATGSRSLFSYQAEEDYVSIDETGLLSFKDEAIGRTAHVTVRSLFSTNNLSRTYEFRHVVKGINVGFGFGANTCEPDRGIMPSFTPYYDALLTMSEDKHFALVFQTNLYMPSKETLNNYSGPYGRIRLNRDIWGNGYKLDGQFFQYDYESHVFEGTDDTQVEEWQTGITVSDLFINSYAPVGDDSKATFEALMEKGGEPIRSFYKERKDFKIAFRYCVFQYSYSHACLIGGTFEFDGCVFRNSAGVSMMIQSLHGQENYVTIHNCIFSNSISMTGIVSNGSFPLEEGEELRYNEVRWTGTNYIYNWKKTDEIRLDIIPRGLMKNEALDKLLEGVNDKLSECARVSFNGSGNQKLVVKDGDDTYVNMGFYFMGFWAPVNPIVNEKRGAITDGTAITVEGQYASFTELWLNSTPLGSVRTLVKDLLDFNAKSYMLTNYDEESGTFNTSPGETYKLNEETYEKLRRAG